MHERFRQQHIRNSERVSESMAKTTAALAEKRRRKAIRNAWKREDHCEFNGDKMSERKERMRNAGATRKPNDSGGQTQKPGPKEKLGGNAQPEHSPEGGWPKSATQHGDARRTWRNGYSPRRGLPLLRSVPLPLSSRLPEQGSFRPSEPVPRNGNRDVRTPPRLDVPTLRREFRTPTGSDVPPPRREMRTPPRPEVPAPRREMRTPPRPDVPAPRREMRTPPRPEVPAPRRDRSLLRRNQIESDFRGHRYPPRSRADIGSYCRPRHVDEGGRGVPREDVRTGNEDRDGPPDRDYRG